ncbi:MAG: grasp-with-spasm system SPASM domain peptide maturase [Bacteroidales bacterium]|nr:grasp-with-spasm system SPASM domain peptide maturase [Bacteroidales bacterium]
MNGFFHLFSCCIPVKGFKKAVICDLQRNIIQPIPLSLYNILVGNGSADVASIEEIAHKYGEKDKQLIQEYITFLYHNQFGYTTEKPLSAIRIDLENYKESRCITNAIVDFDQKSQHRLDQIVPQLNELLCGALEIRYYYQVPYEVLVKYLESIRNSTLRSVELLVEFSDEYVVDHILKINRLYPIVKKFTISNAHEDTVYNHDDLSIIYTTEKIIDERCCGVTNEFYCIAETKLFIESVHFNSCLNKKISVDKSGLIKNCPSMKDSFGHISTTKLKEALENDAFRKVWKINKDQIEVCSDCELRYVCQDCRAYIEDKKNIFSKPIKCNYDPYH